MFAKRVLKVGSGQRFILKETIFNIQNIMTPPELLLALVSVDFWGLISKSNYFDV